MFQDFPGGSDCRICLQCRRPGLIPGLGRFPGKGNGNPLHGELLGQSSLVGYSPRGHKESDTTEQLTISTMFQGLCGALTHTGVKGSFYLQTYRVFLPTRQG